MGETFKITPVEDKKSSKDSTFIDYWKWLALGFALYFIIPNLGALKPILVIVRRIIEFVLNLFPADY